jgi:hypothetical protein
MWWYHGYPPHDEIRLRGDVHSVVVGLGKVWALESDLNRGVTRLVRIEPRRDSVDRRAALRRFEPPLAVGAGSSGRSREPGAGARAADRAPLWTRSIPFWWSNWYGPPARVFHVLLPGGERSAAWSTGPRCDAPAYPSSVTISPYGGGFGL